MVSKSHLTAWGLIKCNGLPWKDLAWMGRKDEVLLVKAHPHILTGKQLVRNPSFNSFATQCVLKKSHNVTLWSGRFHIPPVMLYISIPDSWNSWTPQQTWVWAFGSSRFHIWKKKHNITATPRRNCRLFSLSRQLWKLIYVRDLTDSVYVGIAEEAQRLSSPW